jgi:predicted ATPase
MITQWKVFNFKSIRRETELKIAPLTIFAGANSSGKSTYLQSMLLIAQTLANKIGSRSVVLNGALAKLGQFDDLKSADSDASQIVIGWSCKPITDPRLASMRSGSIRPGSTYYGRSRSMSSISCEIGFDADDSGLQREVTQIQPRLFSSVVSAKAPEADGTDHSGRITIRRATSADETAKHQWIDAVEAGNSLVRASLQYEVGLDETSLSEIREELVSAEAIGCVLRHFLPERLALGIDLAPETARLIVSTLVGEGLRGMPRRAYVERNAVIPRVILLYVLEVAEKIGAAELRQALKSNVFQGNLFPESAISLESFLEIYRRIPSRYTIEFRRHLADDQGFEDRVLTAVREELGERIEVVLNRTPSIIGEACGYLDQYFATLFRYLGPLRDEPKALYPLAPTADPSDIGLKGEYTAAVLDLHKNRSIRYIPTSAFAKDEIVPAPVVRTLEAAVVDWLQYLGVAEGIESHDKGKFGHELVVGIAGGKRHHDLTHVGVGVSQVLPILVTSLLAEPDTTLVFEQPELHLHPKVQTLLADFFLSMTQLGKQCIIETHSEYLINRIRYRTAAAALKSNPWVEAVKVYFVERGPDGSSFREVGINEFGAILDWPEGFFDQNQREAEAILRAASLKRKAKRGS